MSTATATTKVKSSTKTNRTAKPPYALGPNQKKVLAKLPKNTPFSITKVREVAAQFDLSEKYADYMVKGLKDRNYLKNKNGKLVVSDGQRN